MKRRPEFAVLALWLVAIAATFLLVEDRRPFTFLGPLYFVCTMGSILTVRNAGRRPRL